MSSVIVYRDNMKMRGRTVCDAWVQGLRKEKVNFTVRNSETFSGRVEADIAIFYGLNGKLFDVFKTYKEQATSVYTDLGYWKRKPRDNQFGGFHKIAVNDLHSTAYFRKGHPSTRFDRMCVPVKPWRGGTGDHIIVAGMSDKSARVNGLSPEEWERAAIDKLRRHTAFPIWYRPKPSWKEAKPIAGTRYDKTGIDIVPHLRKAAAVVTHHSNAAIDALVEGIPIYCEIGLASTMSVPTLAAIECAEEPPDREGFLYDVAYTQWSVPEIATGKAWRYLKSEQLV